MTLDYALLTMIVSVFLQSEIYAFRINHHISHALVKSEFLPEECFSLSYLNYILTWNETLMSVNCFFPVRG